MPKEKQKPKTKKIKETASEPEMTKEAAMKSMPSLHPNSRMSILSFSCKIGMSRWHLGRLITWLFFKTQSFFTIAFTED